MLKLKDTTSNHFLGAFVSEVLETENFILLSDKNHVVLMSIFLLFDCNDLQEFYTDLRNHFKTFK